METPTPQFSLEAKAYLRYVGGLGGKARARKYSKRTLSKWAKLGGRPRKNGRKRMAARRGKKS